jgi:DNA-binding transcriptional regulator YiaG
MTHDEIKSARQALGLSLSEMAAMLDTDPTTARRLEMDPDKSTARSPAPRMVRLIRAYLDGYRPADWPGQGNPL